METKLAHNEKAQTIVETSHSSIETARDEAVKLLNFIEQNMAKVGLE